VDTAVRGGSCSFRGCRRQLKDEGQCNALWVSAVPYDLSELKMASRHAFLFGISKVGLHTDTSEVSIWERIECTAVMWEQ
jgi:hypothetical protein